MDMVRLLFQNIKSQLVFET